MILRKPYAFLIKYFKLINFILAVLAIYITYRTYNIIGFFNDYITSNYTGNFYVGFSNNYISSFVYFIILLILAGLIGIIFLFVYKKKPLKTYAFAFGYYIVFIIFLIFIKNLMITLETTVITAEISRVYRDLSLLSIIPQMVFIILFLMRAFGFNTKNFNFKADLRELEISEEDNEEVEITFNSDNIKLKRNIRRFIREFSYYIKENKFVLVSLCIIGIILIGYLIYVSLPKIIDKNYMQGETFAIKGINYRIEDSIITNLDYKGDVINKKKYYLIAKLYIENTSKDDNAFDINNFRLEIDDRYIYPVKDKGSYFIDYAKESIGSKIKAESSGTYSLVYEIEESDIKNNYQIKVNNGIGFNNKIEIWRYNYISITPVLIDKVSKEREYNLGNKISFINSNLKKSSIVISNVEITDKYIYSYELCQYGVCNEYKKQVGVDYLQNNKTLIVFDYDYIIDENIPFYSYSSTITSFINSFVKVRYLNNNETVYATVKNITPTNLKDKIILEVSNKIKNTQELAISFIIRNKEYIVKIK